MWWRREKKEISEFLYRLLVTEAPRGYAGQVAQRMGVPYSTMAKYWLGKRRFPAALVKPLFLAADQDPRIAEFFLLDGSAYRLEATEAAAPPDDLARAILVLGTLEADVAAAFLRATATDGEEGTRISRLEREELRNAVQRLILHAEKLCAAFAAADPAAVNQ
jgi:hypothetical protein